ncbi:XRE family transcriptional regulator [Mediterraneibacter gnavus]|uniref:XRE family transcriptional regulator n=1 Tax=Mediterraneibacter gnavus TaxID=33038 RepID=A0A414UZ01_MEDGN|nr:helix-turn-helix transcriptional regulator [Mediterraneibacter gnavus]RHG75393.1 XRE family transcriptional regulator [Mediterraneibacter gnavus]RHG87929.1 XRE family transcriptional regulator [Mediterraneibacter gnavus]
MKFNEKLLEIRKKQGLSQEELGMELQVSRQTISKWESGSRCPDLITAKKLALELKVSMDELISDEAAQDIQINYGIWKLEKIKNRRKLQEFQKKILSFIQTVGAVFLAITLLLRVQLDMSVPMWCTILCLCVVAAALILHFVISKKLEDM